MPSSVPTVMVPCDTVSIVCSTSPVFGVSDTVIALASLSAIAVFSLPLSEAGSASDTVVVSASVMPTVCGPVVAPLTVSVVVTTRLSGP